MPIQPPELDDLRYDRIREDMIRRISVHAPEWTDHNESDPGITLIELFSFLVEQIGFRLNQVPEKNHVELLKLLGVRLKPARAASTNVAFLLADPATAASFVLPARSRVKAKKGDPPPVFETEADIDVVPAQPNVLLTTRGANLWDLLDGTPLPSGTTAPKLPADRTEWLNVIWDGKKPALKDMPAQPVTLFPDPAQNYLWVGLSCNDALDAGFLGARVSLTVQFDDDEQPSLTAKANCSIGTAAEPAPAPVDWLAYFDAVSATMKPIPGRIDDTTQGFTKSGALRFSVPFTFGAIPAAMYRNLRDASILSPSAQCQSLGSHFQTNVNSIVYDPSQANSVAAYLGTLQTAMTKSITDAQAAALSPVPAVPHPLDPKYRDPLKMRGWLRIGPIPLAAGAASPKLRIAIFNAAGVSNATTVERELLGRANGRPGQVFRTANTNVLTGSLELAVQENAGALLTPWKPVESLDPAGPLDRVAEVDWEAGTVLFGDGRRGRIPLLVPSAGNVVALRYRHGGGKSGEVDTGQVTQLETQFAALSGVVNFVKAMGGADAETLEEAKVRARRELSTRTRAVTASDFEWIAKQTPNVRVARVVTVPLKRPLASVSGTPPSSALCGTLPSGPAGLDDSFVAHGVVSVVAVPDETIPEPLPTPSFLRAVCAHLNKHRLITTEVYVIPPQYVRLCNFRVTVKGKPGYTRTRLQDLVEARLGAYLHAITGGDDGAGFPFGSMLHSADLVALLFRVEGIDRVEHLEADFTRTKSNASPRQGKLVICSSAPDHHNRIQLAAEETVSVDLKSFTLSTVA